MFTTREDRNQNTIFWQAVEVNGAFTSIDAGQGFQAASKCGEWPEEDDSFSEVPSSLADEDIKAGRVKKFGSIEDLIADLDSPGE